MKSSSEPQFVRPGKAKLFCLKVKRVAAIPLFTHPPGNLGPSEYLQPFLQGQPLGIQTRKLTGDVYRCLKHEALDSKEYTQYSSIFI